MTVPLRRLRVRVPPRGLPMDDPCRRRRERHGQGHGRRVAWAPLVYTRARGIPPTVRAARHTTTAAAAAAVFSAAENTAHTATRRAGEETGADCTVAHRCLLHQLCCGCGRHVVDVGMEQHAANFDKEAAAPPSSGCGQCASVPSHARALHT